MKIDFSNKVMENSMILPFGEGKESELRLSQEGRAEEDRAKKEKISFQEPEKARELTEALSQLFRAFDLELRFTIHKATREIIARVVNRQTGEVIREIPPEKFLDLVARLRELVGVFVDEMV